MFDISKFCSDSLRNHVSLLSVKLKPSHAHELIAAFFGYKSHAALLHESAYPVADLERVKILIPDLQLMNIRRHQLKELSEDLPETVDLAEAIVLALREQEYFFGEVWLHDSLKNYIAEVFLFENDSQVMDGLSGEMAVTNAEFGGDFPSYDEPEVIDEKDQIVIKVDGVYEGESLDEKPNYGDTIDFQVTITLARIAGKCGFGNYLLETDGEVRDEY